MTESVSTWHLSLIVQPWEKLPGGVMVAHVDDPEQPILLLRDASEVDLFVDALHRAQAAGVGENREVTDAHD